MPKGKISNWTLGITDNYVDGAPEASQKLDNLLLNKDGKPYQRPAFDIYNSSAPQIPAGNQRIDDLYYFQSTLFAKSGTKLYYIQDGETAWTTLSTTESKDAFKDSELGAFCSWSEYRGHLYVTPGPSTNKLGGCRTLKIYRPAPTTWACHHAGLPRAKDEGASDTGVGSGSGSNEQYSYIYAIALVTSYGAYVNGHATAFTHYGTPFIDQVRCEELGSTGGWSPTGPNLTNATDESYPESLTDVVYYRTKKNDTFLLFAQLKAQGSSYDLGDHDDDEIGQPRITSLGLPEYAPEFYMNGGIQANDPVPLCHYSLVLDGCGFYGAYKEIGTGTFYHNRLLQSAPATPDGVPTGNYVEFPGFMTGLDRVGSFPIILTNLGALRVEGRFDAFGGGGMVVKAIPGSKGCLDGSARRVIRTDNGLYYPSSEGWIFTDGFQAYNVSEHLTATYGALTKTRMCGTFDSKRKHVHIGVESAALVPAVSSKNNCLYVLDQNWSKPDYGCFLTATAESNLQPNSLHYDRLNDRLLIGDYRGYVFKFDATKYSDPVVNTATAYSTWARTGIVWDWISCAMSFGDTESEKWFTKLYAMFKKLTGNLSVQFSSRKDLSTTDKDLKVVRDRSISRGIHMIERWFQKGTLWATYQQVRAKKATCIIARSDDYALATANNAANTAVLASGSWPNDGSDNLIGHTIYFSNDSYVAGWVISAQSAGTLTLTDAGNTLPTASGLKWVIKGVPKNESVEFLSKVIEHETQGDAANDYEAGDDGANT